MKTFPRFALLAAAALAIAGLYHVGALDPHAGASALLSDGGYVAMAVVTKYGSGARDPASLLALDNAVAQGVQRAISSQIAITNGDSAASKFYIGKVPSNALILPDSAYYHEAVAGVTDLDVGFENDPDALVDGDDVSSAGSQTLAGHGTFTAPNMNKRAWQLAGLSSDPGGELDVFATLKAASTATKVIHFLLKIAKAA